MAKQDATHATALTGWAGFKTHWQSDLIAGFSVAMVALPLSLGIAQASGVPPIAGIISAAIGGLLTTFIRGGHVSINGPAAGLITVTLGALVSLDDGSGRTYQYVLAAYVVSGAVQVLLGLLRLGRYGELIPSAVIKGVLAAIGVIILGKQVHVALGVEIEAQSTLGILAAIPSSLAQAQPVIASIAALSLLVMVVHPRLPYRWIKFIPAPMWVLIFALGLEYLLRDVPGFTQSLFGQPFPAQGTYFISIPDNLLDGLRLPDFSRIGDVAFWLVVLSITMISTIESLASAKAVDKLDPYFRRTNLNRDLMGVGVSTMVAAAIGGLPVIAVIVRSSVNINNRGRTRWSNFFHGVIILLFALLLTPLIQQVPLAALGAILVFTGYRLAAPRVFRQAAQQGWEQVVFVMATLLATLALGLLYGLLLGILLVLTVQWLRSGLPLLAFGRYLTHLELRHQEPSDDLHQLRIKGVANFTKLFRFRRELDALPRKAEICLDFTHSRLADATLLEHVHEYADQYRRDGGAFIITGLQHHDASTSHPHALHVQTFRPRQPMTRRQSRLAQLAQEHGWRYQRQIEWDASNLRHFHFFDTRPIEYKENIIQGAYPVLDARWEIADITFDEGALLATEVYRSTIETVELPVALPVFALEREGRLDRVFERVIHIPGQVDVDFPEHPAFSRRFWLHGDDEAAIRRFFTPQLIHFFLQHDLYHVESNGRALLLFRRLRLAKAEEITRMIAYCEALVHQVAGNRPE